MAKKFDFLILDLDDTLYSPRNGLWEHVRRRISRYMIQRVGIAPEDVEATRQHYLEAYGTTLRGLSKHHQIDVMDYLDTIHPENMDEYIGPDPALQAMLSALPQNKVIFTNAYRPHADRVLQCLGVSDHFNLVVDILDMDLNNKPHPRAYSTLIELAGITDPATCVYVDDRIANLEPAAALGMTTVHISPLTSPASSYAWIESIIDLPSAVPGLMA